MLIDQHREESIGAHPDAAADAVVLAYRTGPLLADYCRAGSGLTLAGVPLVAMAPAWPIAIGLVALIALFMTFLLQTWRRQHTRVTMAAGAITLTDRAERRLAWKDLEALRLRWFGSRRQGRGWLELELHGSSQRLVLTSALDGFEGVVAAASHAARANGVALDPATQANLADLLGRPA